MTRKAISEGATFRRFACQLRQRGAAAVEFALVLPFLLVLLVGIIDFGFMLYNKAMITNAAREGARAGIVLRNPRLTGEQIETVSKSYCENTLITLIGSHVCTAAATVPAPVTPLESELTVTVRFTYEGPIMSVIALIGGNLDLVTMQSSATMKYE